MENEDKSVVKAPEGMVEPSDVVDPVESVRESMERRIDNGHLPRLTVEEILKRAPDDLIEQEIDMPEWGGSIKIRTLTAYERARIRQVGIRLGAEETAWGEMEVQQFLAAVVEPEFNEMEVRKLQATSGPAFAKVISAHDDLSSMSKEEIRDARKQFQPE